MCWGRRNDRAAKTAAMTGAIVDFDSLVADLVERQDRLTRGHAKVARFCLNHPEEVAITSIVRLAQQAGVTPATITRFARELGLSGFAEFQALFRDRLLGPRPAFADQAMDARAQAAGPDPRPDPGPALHSDPRDGDLTDPGAVLAGFVQAAAGSLFRLEQGIDRAALAAAVATLAQAEVIHVAAARGAYGIGAYLFYGLAKTGVRAQLVDNQGAMRVAQVHAMGARDAMIAITFDDYTPETVQTARLAAEAGQVVLAITDNELSPIVPFARHSLFVKEAALGHFRSQVPALVLCQAMIVSIGSARNADFQN